MSAQGNLLIIRISTHCENNNFPFDEAKGFKVRFNIPSEILKSIYGSKLRQVRSFFDISVVLPFQKYLLQQVHLLITFKRGQHPI